jgi:hypothetical protein
VGSGRNGPGEGRRRRSPRSVGRRRRGAALLPCRRAASPLPRQTQGQERDDVPAPIQGLTDVDAIALGRLHGCALGRLDGQAGDLHCWGDNSEGTLGIGLRAVSIGELVQPLGNGPGVEATSIGADGNNNGGLTCVASTGQVRCFGPHASGADQGRPVVVAALAWAERVQASPDGICGFTSAGAATCVYVGAAFAVFGCASNGACAALDGDRAFGTAADIACRIVDGDARCGGDNTYGVVTAGAPTEAHAPESIVRANVTAIGVGTHHACALGPDGVVRRWGHALFGATGVLVTPADVGPTSPCAGGNARCHGVISVSLPQGVGPVLRLATRQTLSCVVGEGGDVGCRGTLGRGDQGIAPTRFALRPSRG